MHNRTLTWTAQVALFPVLRWLYTLLRRPPPRGAPAAVPVTGGSARPRLSTPAFALARADYQAVGNLHALEIPAATVGRNRLAQGRVHTGLILLHSARTHTRHDIAAVAAAIEKVLRGHPDGLTGSERSAPAESERLKAEQDSWAAARGSSGSVWGWCTVRRGRVSPGVTSS